jgi:hypothetical protein
MEEIKDIKRISESTGLDTGITQDLLNLGKEAGIASDQIESMMDKFVKNLAPGSDPEEALMAIADKMAEIEDPAIRAKVATDAFGKSGAKLIPILKEGADGVRKLSEEWGKLSDAEIDELDQADKVLEKTSNKAKVTLAQWLEGLKMFHEKSKQMPWWKTVLVFPVLNAAIDDAATPSEEEMAHDNAVQAQKTENARKAAEKKKDDALKAARELAEKEDFIRAKPEEKVLMLTRQILAIRRQLEDVDDEKERNKLTEKLVDLEEKRHGIQQKISQDAKTAADKEKKNSEDILKTREQIAKLHRDRDREQISEYMPSLQDVANSGFRVFRHNQMEWQQGPFAVMAQRLLNLQEDAKQSLIWGNKDRFTRDVSHIDELKKSLTDAGVMSPDDKLTNIDDKLKDANTKLADLNKKAETGFVVKGADDDE